MKDLDKIKLNSTTIQTKIDKLLDRVEEAENFAGTDDDYEANIVRENLRQAVNAVQDVQTCVNRITETLDEMYRKAGV